VRYVLASSGYAPGNLTLALGDCRDTSTAKGPASSSTGMSLSIRVVREVILT
jgi:hypothetical protein